MISEAFLVISKIFLMIQNDFLLIFMILSTLNLISIRLNLSHRNANGVGVNGEGVETIKAIKTIKTIQTPKTCMRTRKLSNSYRKTIEKLQFNDLRRIPKKRWAAAAGRRPLFLSITLYSLN